MNKRSTIRRFAPYFKKYKWILLMDLVFAGFTTVCEIIFPLIFRKLTNTALLNPSQLTFTLLRNLAIIYIVLRIVEIFAQFYMQNVGHVMGARIEKDMRKDLFSHIQTLSDNFYNNTKVGSIMSRITTDLFDVTEFAHHCPEEFFIAAIKIVVSFIILFRYNSSLTMIIYALIPVMLYASTNFRKKLKQTFMNQRKHIGNLNAQIEDSLLGIRVVKSFTGEEIEEEKFEKGNDTFLEIKKQSYKFMASFHSINRIFDALMNLTVIIVGGSFLIKGEILAGDLVAYVLYVSTLLATVRRIVEFTEQFQRGVTGIERFFEIMDVKSDIYDKENAINLCNVEGNISLKNVSFKYPNTENYVLEDINIDIKKGQNVAIVGPSGGGKTTVCNLIPRFYDVTSGSITVDSIDIRDIALKSLRSNIGLVQQDVYLFSGTVYDNIEYGKPGASKEEIIEAAKLAGAYDFIMDLANEFDTYIGERGIKLSGGQKQRISIARVFLKNPPILILDEATSALDNSSEKIIQKSLEKLATGRTTLTIAHRLSTIKNSDIIIVLNEKGIVEMGSHEKLMKNKGAYYKLHEIGNNSLATMDIAAI